MIVCLCQGVSDKRVRAAVAGGARTRAEVTSRCGAGGICGGCHDSIKEIIAEHQAGDGRGCEARGAGCARPAESARAAL